MDSIELEPVLGRCIQTTARERHRQLVEHILRCGVATDSEAQEADLLRMFLETADFPRLRAESEPLLVQGSRVVFQISSAGDRVSWKMEER